MSAIRAITRYLTVADVAAQLGLAKPDTVYDWIRNGALAAVNIAANPGGRALWRIAPQAFEQFLSNRTAKPLRKATRRARRNAKRDVIEFF